MQNSPARPVTRRPPRIPYPDLPPVPSEGGTRPKIFWRAAWLRDAAQHQALKGLAARKSFSKETDVLQRAVWASSTTLQRETAKSLATLIECGGLLYAWLPEGGAA